MQMMRAASVLALALLVLGASASRKSSSSESLSQARGWLRSHGPAPQQDELEELKGANPEAYAIVKALLTKRALGLLDPRHPSASFAPGPGTQAEGSAPHMSSVDFAASVGVKAPSQASSEAAPEADDAYPEAPPPVHHSHKDWLNWRPADSAAEDEAQVAQVLGTASQLRTSGAASAVEVAPPAAQPPAQPPAQPAAQPAAAATEPANSYLDGLDLGAAKQTAPEPVAAAPAKQGLVGVKQAVSQESDSRNYLKDFSWFDDSGALAARRPVQSYEDQPLPPAHIVSQDEALPAAGILKPFGSQPEAVTAQAAATTAPPQKQNPLVSWLGSSWGPVQARPAAKPPSPSQTSSHGAGHYSQYLEDLKDF